MRALFVGDLRCPSASGRQRLWALQQCGVEVTVLNKDDYASLLGKWGGRLAKVARTPRLMRNGSRLAADLIKLCETLRPDLVWFEWPKEFSPTTLRKLRSMANAPMLISFQDDNPWGDRTNDQWMWRDYLKVIGEFDLHLVKRPEDQKRLQGLGAKETRLWSHGVYWPVFHPVTENCEKIYPVSFVGTCMDGREKLVGHLLQSGVPLHVFGARWHERSNLPRLFPKFFHPYISAGDYADVIRRSSICLGLVSHSNHDEWTMRTYEVPGCASLLLAERTPTQMQMFEDGVEAAFFSSHEECAAVAHELLASPDRCAEMGRAAFQKTSTQEWGLDQRMKLLLEELGFTNLKPNAR